MKSNQTFIICILALLVLNCKKDKSGEDANIVKDIDGNVYHTITIGSQTWMLENLKVTRYRNGDSIGTTHPPNKDISREKDPKYQWAYNGRLDIVETHGRLYTWYAATDERCLCPEGWHVPSGEEWTELENYLIENGYNYDGTTSGNKIAKALADTCFWPYYSKEGTVGNTDYPEYRNKSGLSFRPGGFHYRYGAFDYYGFVGWYWTSTEASEFGGLHKVISYLNVSINQGDYGKLYGFSVRCIKDQSK